MGLIKRYREDICRVNEAKQVGILYHVCSLESYMKYIKPNDVLTSSGTYMNHLYKGTDYVSFTRDKYYTVSTRENRASEVIIQLVIDGDKLSEKYKVKPYNNLAYSKGELKSDNDIVQYREKEEVVKGAIKNISSYIKAINIDFRDLHEKCLKQLKKSGLIEEGAFYKPFIKSEFLKEMNLNNIREFFKEHGVKAGMSVKSILKVIREFIKQDNSYEEFRDALFSNDVNIINDLLEDKELYTAELNRNYGGSFGYPLIYYMKSNKIDSMDRNVIIRILLMHGAKATSKDDYCPAAYLFNKTIIEEDSDDVIARGLLWIGRLDINTKWGKGHLEKTLLTRAIELQRKDTFLLFMDYKPDVNLPNGKGETPLMLAAKSKDTTYVRELLQAGADVTVKSPDGKTALDFANRYTKPLLERVTKSK